MTTAAGAVRPVSGPDAAHLTIERSGGADTIGVLGVLDGGPLLTPDGLIDVERLREVLAPRVAALPALNRRVSATSDGGPPSWRAARVDLGAHVRTGPAIEGEKGLTDLGARALEEPLPRDRPLWDLVVVPGPGPGRAALVLRLHHALADAVSAAGIAARLFDPTPTTTPTTPGAVPAPGRPARPPVHTTSALLGRIRAATAVLGMALRPQPRTSLLGPLGRGRRIGLVEADLTAVRARGHARGATVNDVLLDAVAGAVADVVRARGERVPHRVRASVPVALPPSPRDDSANRVGVMIVPLPLAGFGPDERLAAITAVTRREAPRARSAGTLPLMRGRLGARAMALLSRHQRLVTLFVTDVRGPRERLGLAGAEMTAAWPLTSLAGNVRLAVAAMTYGDRLSVTVVADAASTPDVDVFVSALGMSLTLPRTPARRPDTAGSTSPFRQGRDP